MSLKSSEKTREQEKSDTFDDLQRLEQETEVAALFQGVPFTALLSHLSEHEKELFLMKASGLSLKAIADRMGGDVNQIRYELNKAEARIRYRIRELVRSGVFENPQEPEELLTLTMPEKEVPALTAKVLMILRDARQSEHQVAEDQQEIDRLKMETRQILERLRAA